MRNLEAAAVLSDEKEDYGCHKRAEHFTNPGNHQKMKLFDFCGVMEIDKNMNTDLVEFQIIVNELVKDGPTDHCNPQTSLFQVH